MAKVRRTASASGFEYWSDADFVIEPNGWKSSAAFVYEINDDYSLVFKADSMAIFLQQFTHDWNSDIMPAIDAIADSGRIEITLEGPLTSKNETAALWELAKERITDSKCPAEIKTALFENMPCSVMKMSLPKHDSKPFSMGVYEEFWGEWFGTGA